MSSTLSAKRRGMSAALAGAMALALIALVAVGPAPRAQAAFSLPQCGGVEIAGRGASFARDAHVLFNNYFHSSVCPGGSIDVAYEPLGSGAGREAVKNRTLQPRFGMSDEAPDATEVLRINRGVKGSEDPNTDPDPEDNGEIHVIPAAVGAVAPLVNLPSGCTQVNVNAIPTNPAEPVSRTIEQDRTLDTILDGVVRLRFREDVYEEIWAQGDEGPGSYLTWGELVPAFSGTGATCGDKAVIRVVRFDDSGTTFTFKDYLNELEAGREWKTKYTEEAANGRTRHWPGAAFGDRDDCGDKDGIAEPSDPDGPGGPGLAGDTDQLTSSCAGNAANLVNTLISTDGSVGYADISTARVAGLEITPRTAEAGAGSAFDNDTYWTQAQNGGNGDFEEPTSNQQFGFRTDGSKGANCAKTKFLNVPNSTLGSWFATSGVHSPEGYPVCTMTYGLVFDDNSDVWGGGATEEAKARTVKDYWTGIVSDGAQNLLKISDYAPLPEDIQQIAQKGVEAVNWEGAPLPPPPPPPPPPPVVLGPTPAPPPVSNLFSLPRKAISSKTGQATISVKIPGPGMVELAGSANVSNGKSARKGKKAIKVGRTVLNASQAGTYKLTLKPSAAAMAQLREKGKLRVNLKVTFTPTGGVANTSTSSITLKLSKPKPKKR
jgi:ABC-type phosphate transport system substrate-binding protein